MASINGFEVKAVKHYPNHEGMPTPYGNLYYQNKKVGEFSYDSWGGPMHYHHSSKTITEEEVRKEMSKLVQANGWHNFYDSFDVIIEQLINFKELEKEFNKAQKENRYLGVATVDLTKDPMEEGVFDYLGDEIYKINSDLTEERRKEVEEEVIKKHPNQVVVFYRTSEDFTINK